MNLFENKSLYDAKLKNWVEFFFVNGQEVNSDEYFDLLDLETQIEDEKVEDNCNCEVCIDEMLDEYVARLEEVCCPECMKEILHELVAEILEGMDRLD